MPALSLPLPSLMLRAALLGLLLSTALAASLAFGARDLTLMQVWQGLTHADPANPAADGAIVLGLRLSRTLTGVAVGAALAVAGVLMQALTRNPLADPGLTGINAGAALAVVAVIRIWGPQDPLWLAAAAMAGAFCAAFAVWHLAGGRSAAAGGAISLRLPLAGAAIGSLCLSLVAAVVLLNPQTRDLYRFWMVGSLAGAEMATLARLAPLMALGLALGLVVARGLDVLALGADLGTGLGVRAGPVLTGALLSVTLCAGAAVALAGPLGFVGLIVPHLARFLAGRGGLAATLLCAVPLGAALVLACDTLGRVMARPSELALGIVLALIGGPAFMLLLHRLIGPRG